MALSVSYSFNGVADTRTALSAGLSGTAATALLATFVVLAALEIMPVWAYGIGGACFVGTLAIGALIATLRSGEEVVKIPEKVLPLVQSGINGPVNSDKLTGTIKLDLLQSTLDFFKLANAYKNQEPTFIVNPHLLYSRGATSQLPGQFFSEIKSPLEHIKNSKGEVLKNDPDHLYFNVEIYINSSNQFVSACLPSYMIFDEDGKVMNPISFYFCDELYNLSTNNLDRLDTYFEDNPKTPCDYDFSPDTVKSLRKLQKKFEQERLLLIEKNDIFCGISADSTQFAMVNNQFELIPYTPKKVPISEPIEEIKALIHNLDKSYTCIGEVAGFDRSSVETGQLTVIMDKKNRTLWLHTNQGKKQRVAVLSFLADADFAKASLTISNGIATITIPKYEATAL